MLPHANPYAATQKGRPNQSCSEGSVTFCAELQDGPRSADTGTPGPVTSVLSQATQMAVLTKQRHCQSNKQQVVRKACRSYNRNRLQ
jgi:hypothetical protein